MQGSLAWVLGEEKPSEQPASEGVQRTSEDTVVEPPVSVPRETNPWDRWCEGNNSCAWTQRGSRGFMHAGSRETREGVATQGRG